MKSLKSCAVHCSPATKFTFGMIVTMRVPLPATVAEAWLPVVLQLMSYHEPLTSTGSLNVMTRFASRGAMALLLRGSTFTTDGPSSWIGDVRRGFAAAVEKSAPLTFVSTLPLLARYIAPVEFAGAVAVLLPSL